jgi:ShK domain-like
MKSIALILFNFVYSTLLLRPETLRPSSVTEIPQAMRHCKDRKHFCTAWKKAGFCQGIFVSYMKKNCPAACGWC